MKHRKRRQRVAPSSKFVAFDSERASACRMERLEDRQLLSATIDLRTTSGGKSVTITSVGQVVNLDVWAVVTGADGTATNDAFQWAHGSFLSSDAGGGAVAGTAGLMAAGAAREEAKTLTRALTESSVQCANGAPNPCQDVDAAVNKVMAFTAIGAGGIAISAIGGTLVIYELVRTAPQEHQTSTRIAVTVAPGGGALKVAGSI